MGKHSIKLPSNQQLDRALDRLMTRRMDPKLRKANDAEFLSWIADRIVHVYKESPNVDFVLKLRAIASSLKTQ